MAESANGFSKIYWAMSQICLRVGKCRHHKRIPSLPEGQATLTCLKTSYSYDAGELILHCHIDGEFISCDLSG